MTTRIKIENLETSGHTIEIFGGNIGMGIGGKLLKPGESIEMYFWKESPISIKEVHDLIVEMN